MSRNWKKSRESVCDFKSHAQKSVRMQKGKCVKLNCLTSNHYLIRHLHSSSFRSPNRSSQKTLNTKKNIRMSSPQMTSNKWETGKINLKTIINDEITFSLSFSFGRWNVWSRIRIFRWWPFTRAFLSCRLICRRLVCGRPFRWGLFGKNQLWFWRRFGITLSKRHKIFLILWIRPVQTIFWTSPTLFRNVRRFVDVVRDCVVQRTFFVAIEGIFRHRITHGYKNNLNKLKHKILTTTTK